MLDGIEGQFFRDGVQPDRTIAFRLACHGGRVLMSKLHLAEPPVISSQDQPPHPADSDQQ